MFFLSGRLTSYPKRRSRGPRRALRALGWRKARHSLAPTRKVGKSEDRKVGESEDREVGESEDREVGEK